VASDQFTFDDYIQRLMKLEELDTFGVSGKRDPADQVFSRVYWDPILANVRSVRDQMTSEERHNPDIVDAERRRRIATGSGVKPREVSQFLKQFVITRAFEMQMRSMSTWQCFLCILGVRRWPGFPPAG
jgi:signal recognition particle subunit SRP54